MGFEVSNIFAVFNFFSIFFCSEIRKARPIEMVNSKKHLSHIYQYHFLKLQRENVGEKSLIYQLYSFCQVTQVNFVAVLISAKIYKA